MYTPATNQLIASPLTHQYHLCLPTIVVQLLSQFSCVQLSQTIIHDLIITIDLIYKSTQNLSSIRSTSAKSTIFNLNSLILLMLLSTRLASTAPTPQQSTSTATQSTPPIVYNHSSTTNLNANDYQANFMMISTDLKVKLIKLD